MSAEAVKYADVIPVAEVIEHMKQHPGANR